MSTRWILLLLFLLLFAPALPTLGGSGDLDSGFGDGGKLVLDSVQGAGDALIVQPDGKILVGGSFGLMRLLQDGRVDNSFGSNGMATVSLSTNGISVINALARQSNGSIIASVGSALVRFTEEGELDSSFGQGGIASTLLVTNHNDQTTLLALQPSGKIMAAGLSSIPLHGGLSIYLSRFNSEGNLDTTFATVGTALLDFGSQLNVVRAIAVQNDGKIIVAGGALIQNILVFALARYTSDGALDGGFGTGGKVTTQFDGATFSQINGIALQSDGKIIAAGVSNGTNDSDFVLAHYDPDGSLDSTFGTQGYVRTDLFGGNRDVAFAVGTLSDGGIVVAGSTGPSVFREQFVLARYLLNGDLDQMFGENGVVTTQFEPSLTDEPHALVVQDDGRVLLTGQSSSNGTNVCVFARYHVADLGVVQTATPDGLSVGSNVKYVSTVKNDRPDTVSGTIFIDTLPSSVDFVSALSTQGVCTNLNGTIVCDLHSFASGGAATVTIVASVKTTAHLCNTSIVELNEADPAITNSSIACAQLDPSTETPQDLAVTRIRVPKQIVLSDKNSIQAATVAVRIQNRSPHPETITNLEGVVNLEVRSLTNTCPDLVPVLMEPPLPVTLQPRATFDAMFEVTFSTDCVPDPLVTKKSASHNDYSYFASVNHAAIDDNRDTHPQDDVCPHDPLGEDPTPGHKIQDHGCGGRIRGGFGAPVVTDVIVK